MSSQESQIRGGVLLHGFFTMAGTQETLVERTKTQKMRFSQLILSSCRAHKETQGRERKCLAEVTHGKMGPSWQAPHSYLATMVMTQLLQDIACQPSS